MRDICMPTPFIIHARIIIVTSFRETFSISIFGVKLSSLFVWHHFLVCGLQNSVVLHFIFYEMPTIPFAAITLAVMRLRRIHICIWCDFTMCVGVWACVHGCLAVRWACPMHVALVSLQSLFEQCHIGLINKIFEGGKMLPNNRYENKCQAELL